ncbi:MAG: response regulator [Desulfomonile tiedjei]|nr:response regulator [Desulfomonile tiedjei]
MASNTMKNCSKQGETETILLVEDEDLVSDLTKRFLEGSGYTVLTAANGKEALDLYEKEGDRVSLVILDLIMPEMGGRECLAALRKVDPNVKILIISGYPVSGPTKETFDSVATAFVGKPYTMKEILRAVRDVLDSE